MFEISFIVEGQSRRYPWRSNGGGPGRTASSQRRIRSAERGCAGRFPTRRLPDPRS
jgi:hypothetical protein